VASASDNHDRRLDLVGISHNFAVALPAGDSPLVSSRKATVFSDRPTAAKLTSGEVSQLGRYGVESIRAIPRRRLHRDLHREVPLFRSGDGGQTEPQRGRALFLGTR
jgi:hypothetical protein